MWEAEKCGSKFGGLKRLKNRTENGRVYIAKFKAQIWLKIIAQAQICLLRHALASKFKRASLSRRTLAR